MDRAEFCARLDEELRTDAYADLDASPNGLQVGSGDGEINHVAVAVDAAAATAEAAVEAGADILVTHHGYVFGSVERVTGRLHDRLEPHYEYDLPLYVSHLPLDGHQDLGNAAGVADLLGLENREPFGEMGSEYVGQRGTAPDGFTAEELQDMLSADLDHGGQGVQVLDFGPDVIEDVAIVTGSGVDWLDEAEAVGADALLTGEGKQQAYHEAREAGITVVLGGHYATETFGVQSLADLAESWGLETTFVDHPTGL
ncbi:Nif3-like dinuclear metal center hexameric protein [Halorientalis regularis]|jgi:dinuclear metal center YbgI/SA1388 family protein|uniref:Dinuclear metal center protein, YbgI/SA1388 family n=1 Tax=Halorientalis regularis TaxID=660518 RepID=A0A1G7MDE8_9EURY|nr:Nif3-like dinuclear metal center hexameric protein [Halorientalis regularis]SDF59837.1 dinuclear metal center protein, YbgI/SA1388 family [Halorientalis regularis]